MFCGTCGNQLRDGAKFCDQCGAVQPIVPAPTPVRKPADPIKPVWKVQPRQPKPAKPPKEPKVRKKWNKGLLAAVCGILLVAIAAAVVIPILFPGTQTVYLLTSYTYTNQDGTVRSFEYEYDEAGKPLLWQDSYMTFQASYDELGNLAEKTRITQMPKDDPDNSYRYTYDEQDRIRSCAVYAYDKKVGTWDFTWDKKGNLIQAQMRGKITHPYGLHPRVDFVYDDDGRLFREYFFTGLPGKDLKYAQYSLFCFEYSYNDAGLLKSIDIGSCEDTFDDFEGIDPEEESMDMVTVYELDYDAEGRLIRLESVPENRVAVHNYDRDGNYTSDGNEYIYDDNGNLIRIEYDSGAVAEYTYEAVTLSREDAQRHQRWKHICHLDPIATRTYPLLAANHPKDYFFFYYLVDSPVW